jgi:penicillin-binding protein-related factor A (putative recombinase)
MLEKNIETEILTYLNAQNGVFAFKVQTAGFFDTKRKIFRKNLSRFIIPGTSDIIGVYHGRFFAFEVKTPTTIRRFNNHPTEADQKQIHFLQLVRDHGGIAACVSSVEDVMQILQVSISTKTPISR